MTEKVDSTRTVAAQGFKQGEAEEPAVLWTSVSGASGYTPNNEALLVAALLGVSKERAAEALKAMKHGKADG